MKKKKETQEEIIDDLLQYCFGKPSSEVDDHIVKNGTLMNILKSKFEVKRRKKLAQQVKNLENEK